MKIIPFNRLPDTTAWIVVVMGRGRVIMRKSAPQRGSRAKLAPGGGARTLGPGNPRSRPTTPGRQPEAIAVAAS